MSFRDDLPMKGTKMEGTKSSAEGSPEPSASPPTLPPVHPSFSGNVHELGGPLLPYFPSRMLGDETRERQSVESDPVGRATSETKDPSLQLNEAIRAKQLSEVTKLIQSGLDVNRPYRLPGKHSARDSLILGGFPICQAAAVGKEITKLLIDSGAIVDAQYAFHGTALQNAALKGDYETVELLINAGADVNATPGVDGTALACAIESNKASLEKVRLLLEHGADINGKTRWDISIKRIACYRRPVLFPIFLAHGVDVAAEPDIPDLWRNISCKQPYDSILRLGFDLVAGNAISAIGGISFDWTTPAGLVHSLKRSSPAFDRPMESSSAELLARQFVLVAERSPDKEPSMILGTRCSEFALGHWGKDGLISLQCIMDNIYLSFDGGPKGCAIIHNHPDTSVCSYLDKISCSESRVELLLGTFEPPLEALETLLSVVSFFCTAIADPLVSTPFVSTSSRIHLEVDPLSVMDVKRPLRLRLSVDKAPFCPSRDNCWQNLLEVGVVARVETPRPTLTLPGRGIRLTFDLMIALASIERSVVINKTIVLIGYRTALIPIEIHDDFVQYHLIVSDSDQISLQCFPNELDKAVDVNDIDQLLHKSCFIGWCGEAHIQLGTTLMTKLTLPRYSTAREKGESFHLNGLNLSICALLPAPVQVGPTLQLEGTFRINRVKFSYLSGYAELLRDTSRKAILLYDTATKRGWIVPKLSLLLHMCHAYMAFHEEQDPIPIIPGSSDAKPIVKALDKEGNLALFGSPPHEFRLHNLLHGLNYNMRLVAEKTEPSKGHTLNGFEFCDIFAMPDKGALMKKISLDTNGRSWIHMANLADAVIFGHGFGDVITAPRVGNWARLDNCTAVPAGFEYLTTTVPYLKNLAFNRPGFVDQEVQDYQIEIGEGIFWAVSMASFNKCNLKHGNDGSCWNIDDIYQQLLKPKLRKNGTRRPQISLSQLPDTGAVVFGCSPPAKRPQT